MYPFVKMFKFTSLKYTIVLQSHQHPPPPSRPFFSANIHCKFDFISAICCFLIERKYGSPMCCSTYRAVIKSRGAGISPGYYECGCRLLLMENKRKLEPKETPRSLIPRLLLVFIRQLEILTTTLT